MYSYYFIAFKGLTKKLKSLYYISHTYGLRKQITSKTIYIKQCWEYFPTEIESNNKMASNLLTLNYLTVLCSFVV